MSDSKFGLKSIELVEIGRKMKKSSKMDIKRSRYDHLLFFVQIINDFEKFGGGPKSTKPDFGKGRNLSLIRIINGKTNRDLI